MQPMTGCAIKRGFFVLRDCGNAAYQVCQYCSRSVCQEHLSMRGQILACLDCQARQQQMTEEDQTNLIAGENAFGRSGIHSYRHNYYANQHYAPFYTGLYYSQYYDSYDTRAFDKRAAPEGFDDESLSMGFLDS
ncbi:MAG: hypothetical protein AB1757_04965 [Acidobacteriota bacterium]